MIYMIDDMVSPWGITLSQNSSRELDEFITFQERPHYSFIFFLPLTATLHT